MPTLSTLGPAAPVSPLSPLGPCAPVAPVAPLAPVSPFGPCAPVAPVAPRAPVAPFRFLNAKLNTFAVLLPVAVTVTEGVPTFASTVAVGVPNPAAAPVAPVAPAAPSLRTRCSGITLGTLHSRIPFISLGDGKI